jgi:hypothetical protein
MWSARSKPVAYLGYTPDNAAADSNRRWQLARGVPASNRPQADAQQFCQTARVGHER